MAPPSRRDSSMTPFCSGPNMYSIYSVKDIHMYICPYCTVQLHTLGFVEIEVRAHMESVQSD